MEKRHLDGLVVYGDSGSHSGNQANIFYLTGYRDPLFSYVLVPLGQEPILITDTGAEALQKYPMKFVEI